MDSRFQSIWNENLLWHQHHCRTYCKEPTFTPAPAADKFWRYADGTSPGTGYRVKLDVKGDVKGKPSTFQKKVQVVTWIQTDFCLTKLVEMCRIFGYGGGHCFGNLTKKPDAACSLEAGKAAHENKARWAHQIVPALTHTHTECVSAWHFDSGLLLEVETCHFWWDIIGKRHKKIQMGRIQRLRSCNSLQKLDPGILQRFLRLWCGGQSESSRFAWREVCFELAMGTFESTKFGRFSWNFVDSFRQTLLWMEKFARVLPCELGWQNIVAPGEFW